LLKEFSEFDDFNGAIVKKLQALSRKLRKSRKVFCVFLCVERSKTPKDRRNRTSCGKIRIPKKKLIIKNM